MTLEARGLITIGGVQLTSDPEKYEHYDWPKRWSKHPGIGGSVTIQDFGHVARDLVLRLESGAHQYLTLEVVRALDTAHRSKGVVYAVTDWLANDMDVFIARFKPESTRLPGLFTYSMELHAWTIRTWLGATYTGG